MNAKSLPTYQQFKVKKQITIKEKEKECGSSALEEKSSLKEISEANVMDLAGSHPHLALLEQVALL